MHESKGILIGDLKSVVQRSSQIERLLHSWIRAEEELWQYPDAIQNILARCLKLESDALARIQTALMGTRAEVKITNSLRHSYERSRDWFLLRKNFRPDEIPSFFSILDSNHLMGVRPRSVTVGPGG